MHLTSFTSRAYPFFSPFFAPQTNVSSTDLERLQWVQPSADSVYTLSYQGQQLIAYDFSTSVDKTVNYSRSIFARLADKGWLPSRNTVNQLSQLTLSQLSLNDFSLKKLSSKSAQYASAHKYPLAMLLVGLSALAVPAKQYLHNLPKIATVTPTSNAVPAYPAQAVMTIKPTVLTIATVKSSETYFADDKAGFSYAHGFGYDVVRNYASQLGNTLAVTVYDTNDAALQAVKMGQADMALTSLNTSQTAYFQPTLQKASFMPSVPTAQSNHKTSTNTTASLKALSLSCHQDFLQKNGLDSYLSLSVSAANTSLAQNASNFLCDTKTLALNEKLAGFYTQNILKDDYSQQHFKEAMSENLPMYQYSFKQSAKNYNHDWQLLVAMSYQESHLEPNATSPTGVQGIMMLTNDTAKAMGVTDRIDPVQSIQGGAKYLNQLSEQFRDINEADRVWFMLASYNMGPMAVKNIQNTLAEQGKNPHSWAEVYRYMAENTDKNRRYAQCMDYVTNIRGYLEQIKLENTSTLPSQRLPANTNQPALKSA